MVTLKVLILGVGLMTTGAGGASAPSAPVVYEDLKGLLGAWQGIDQEGQKWTVHYRLIAGGHALVETWSPGSQNEALTIYMLDGDSLIATHVCPWGNQPRLRLSLASKLHDYRFEFVGGANLHVADAYHQVRFRLRIEGRNRFMRSEVYAPNKPVPGLPPGSPDEGAMVTYTRVEGAKTIEKAK